MLFVKRNFLITALMAALLAAALCACGAVYSEDGSPKLLSVEAWGENDGTEEGQYILAGLTFDRDVAVSESAAGQLRVTVGGTRIAEDDIALSADGAEVILRARVTYSTTGELVITPARSGEAITGITDVSGKYALGTLDVSVYVPSGITLERKGEGDGFAVYSVASLWTHRGIFWVKVLVDGSALAPDRSDSTEVLSSGAVAVHGHYFRTETESDAAKNIADVLNYYFGSALTATAEKGEISVRLLDGGGVVELCEYLGED